MYRIFGEALTGDSEEKAPQQFFNFILYFIYILLHFRVLHTEQRDSVSCILFRGRWEQDESDNSWLLHITINWPGLQLNIIWSYLTIKHYLKLFTYFWIPKFARSVEAFLVLHMRQNFGILEGNNIIFRKKNYGSQTSMVQRQRNNILKSYPLFYLVEFLVRS